MKSIKFCDTSLSSYHQNNGYTMEMSIEESDLGQEENSTDHV
jgi:hypothetical protein